ncbi:MULTISPECIES: ABC transporter substrate-binding protein [unclassified Burkholderia]|uniref:ABC transporter substrate-binding protein n=1 Tax=unclassified Burkholderia TaxID=2613784 RepID=UPI000F58604C|nr:MULTISPECIES: ABC transporter substrate-binding protein [unclassified Burkholderia]RQR45073.1 ABC transporter substrate-binding protein [Burkholderia sp. Bp9131]RQR76934.1 ABC transporter substrate-binding protein [Burkholderia sp. Bp9015]RQR85833.1 ABC transporter substrate-binding protein [Burkholderia sp. Bp9011]RQR95436.1 ABC transporter substrate-binding protein [Burkholderia sp. Bp9010]RQS00761.1 ABC transporter substrate-binding protein [Burkholderia sp. Bp8994]
MNRTARLLASALAFAPLVSFAQDTATIRWGIDPTYPPFEAKQPDGSLAGFDIDLRNAICEQLRAKCVWVEQGFDGMIPALRARKFDVIMSAMTATDERLKQIDFSNKLYASPGALVAPAGSKLLPTAASLAGKRVGIDQGTTQEAYAKAEWATKGVTIVSYQNQDQVYQDLVNGRLDATFQDKTQAGYSFLKTPRGKGYAFAGPDVTDVRITGYGVAMGVRKGDAEMKKRLNDAIVAIRANGTYQKIAAKYFDFDIYGAKQQLTSAP